MCHENDFESEIVVLTPDDVQALNKLVQFIRSLKSLISSGEGLMGLGAAIMAIEEALEEGGLPDENWPIGTIDVSIGFEQGDRDFREGHHYSIDMSQEGITLDYLYRCYTSDYGSDHRSDTMAELSSASSFDDFAVEQWLRKAKELLQFENVRVNASVDIW